MIAFLDGDWLDDARACVSIHDRGLTAGDAIFETALLHAGAYFRLDAHLERFQQSARTCRLAAPPAVELARIARELASRNDLRDGGLRITLTRGTHRGPTLIATLARPDPAGTERLRRGWRLITARTTRPSITAAPAQLKTIGRVHSLLARLEAQDAGADDALLLTDSGAVCEGPSWNIFWRRGAALHTPALELGVLAGITRAVLLELAPACDLAVREGVWDRAALDDAEEIFATMTSVGLVPIRALDDRTLPVDTPAADRLHAGYWATVAAETARAPA